ncbi:MAG: glycosyltransferase [Clostridium sp.]|nr:glycosyltransferase [Clostridium sp.]
MDTDLLLTYDFSDTTILLAAVAAGALAIMLTLWLSVLRRIRRRVASDSEEPLLAGGYPDVSVVVYASNDGWNISDLVADIFGQDYPAAMEVIIVNDGSFDNTEDIIGQLELTYSNLYLTFAPSHSRNLSRRKLAITLGVKAARYDCVVLTRGNCRIPSNEWLKRMTRHVAAGKEVVVGYAAMADGADCRGAFRIRAFDAVYQAITWILPALDRRVFRGDGANLAYTRKIFFDNKGFSRSLNLNNGDDDIFISEIATRANSAIELSRQSMVEVHDTTPKKSHIFNKLSRRFTGQKLTFWPRVLLSVGCWMWWIFAAAGIAASLTALPSVIPAGAFAVLFLTAGVLVSASWRRTSRALMSRPLLLTVVPLMFWHLFYNFSYLVKGITWRKKNFTWTNGI